MKIELVGPKVDRLIESLSEGDEIVTSSARWAVTNVTHRASYGSPHMTITVEVVPIADGRE